ncbi:accessory gene regulator B family protein [Paenibacillus chitinolyticus]|uniref:accessory gene regulator B family protein n=1 Tax=Paenibacillus chitinolyticus TaxID=79263 RepID=UPI00367340C2
MCDLLRTTILKVDNGRSDGYLVYYLAEKLAHFLAVETGEDKEAIEHGLKIQLNFILIFLILFCVGIFINRSIDIAISALSLILIRKFTGGRHFKNSDICILFTTVVIVTIQYISDFIVPSQIQIINLITIFLILLFCPFGSIFEIKDRQVVRKKIICISIVLINMISASSSIAAVAFFVQGLDLITFKRTNQI